MPRLVPNGDGEVFVKLTIRETATIVVTAESRLIDWNRPRIRRYTDGDQQERFSGDLGFQFMSDASEKEINWGGKVTAGQTESAGTTLAEAIVS